MERSPLWICLLGAGLTMGLSVTNFKAEPGPPQLSGCEFLTRANVTCRWKAGGTLTTNYTLQVHLMFHLCLPWGSISPDYQILKNSTKKFTCTTPDTSCAAPLEGTTVRNCFCTIITAHGPNQNISSQPRCQSGRIEMKLPPVTLNSVKSVSHRPDCLNVTWSRMYSEFSVSDQEIKAGSLTSQIQITPQGQFVAQEENVNVTDKTFTVCRLRPDTLYTIRLRHRYRGKESPWSLWSNACQGTTGEAAPSAAPSFWRRVKQTDRSGGRLTSLLWKPLPRPLANGRVLFFNVTCRTESAQVLNDHGSCRDLHHTRTSCSLLLPAGRCSCALTASTSAGTSPKAQIWLLGASETEPPPPSQITATPLDDSHLDVRWAEPGDWSLSGFVVEWFAVREKNSSILHWEKLSSSRRALVITEGIKPLERYAVSVTALHGERGAGRNSTVHIYTRQGAPSAGPKVVVQKISGSSLELTWSPAPEELLHGFIRNYTIKYTTAHRAALIATVPAHTLRYSLDLLPGDYHILMYANTDAGAGAAGHANAHIGSEEISIVMYAVLPLTLTSLALVLMACLAQNKMVKQKLCHDIPDPSNSSLAHWTPKITLESIKWMTMAEKTEINHSEVILLSESELQNYDPDQDLSYQSGLQTESSQRYSPLPVSQTPQIYRKSENKYKKSSARAKTTSNTELSSCPCIYSNVFFSQTPKGPPIALLSPSYLQSNDWQHSTVSINDVKLQLGGDSETYLQGRSTTKSASPLSHTDELKTFCLLLKQHQSLVSSSSAPLSHPADSPAPQHPFSHSIYNSVPSLRPDAFSRLEDSFTTSFPPSPHSTPLVVDFSYCPVERNPHISPAV